jgi:hypothetical protein
MVSPAQSTRFCQRSLAQPSLTRLLRAAADDRTDLVLADFRDDHIRWAIETGLGPLLRRVMAADPEATRSPLWPLVDGADLTARVIAEEQRRALDEIIRACEGRTSPLTLLKGMSISAQYYPEPHLRLMRDIDILVEPAAVPNVEQLLRRLGYRQPSPHPPEWLSISHHTAPFLHPDTGIWVEVHRALFSADSDVSSDKVFSPDNLRAELLSSEYGGRAVYHLSDEFQLVYVATHWAREFKRVGGMVGMLDLIYLIRSSPALRWKQIVEWLDGSVACAHVCVLLSYLDRHELVDIPPGILADLFSGQRSFGRTNLSILHALLDQYVTDGREFGWLVSARNVDRVWASLLRPSRPTRNALIGLWSLLPYSVTLARAARRLRKNRVAA